MNGTSYTAPKALLLDLDGLIVDTEPLHQQAFQVVMRRRGIELPPDIMGSLIGYDQVTNLRDLKRIYGLQESVDDLLIERMQVYEDLVLTEPIPVLAGFWELDHRARELGLKRAVVSSSTFRQVHVVLSRLLEGTECADYRRFFDHVLTGDDVAQTKPAPDLYLLALERLGVTAAECLALEDSPVGLTAAVTAGIRCLAVPSQYARVQEFAGQLAVLDSLHEAVPYLTNGHA